MDKLRSIISPGKPKDDEVMYGSGTTSSHANAGLVSGPGSHFPSATSGSGATDSTVADDTTSTTAVRDGVSGAAQPTGSGLTSGTHTTAGPHSSDLANKVDPRVDSDRDGSRTVGNSTTSGVAGSGTTGVTGSSANTANTTAGPHSSSILNKLDPRVDSTTGNTSADTSSNTSGFTGNTSSTTGDHQYGRDAGLATGAGAAGLGYEAERNRELNNQTGSSVLGNTSSTTGSSTLGNSNTSTSTGTTGTTAPHSSNLLNKLDPRVDSSATGTGRHGASGLGPLEPAQDFDGTQPDHPGPHPYQTRAGAVLDPHGPGHTSMLGGSSTSGTGYDSTTGSTSHGHLGRDAAIVGGTGAGVGAYETERNRDTGAGSGLMSSSTSTGQGPHNSSLLNKLDPRVDSTTGATTTSNTNTGSTTAGSNTGVSGTSTSGQGPHSSSLLNKLDPRVDSTTGQWKSSEKSASGATGQSNVGRDATLAGGAGLAGYEADKHHRQTTTAGPHDSNIANKMDPRVDSDRDGSRTAGTTGITGDRTYDNTGAGSHHHGRDAALVGGVGAAGYEAEKHHRHHETSTTGPSSNTNSAVGAGQGPHSSSLLNRLDPRVDSNTGATSSSTTGDRTYDNTSSRSHHHGRDAAVVGGVGAAGYEAEKHHHRDENLTGTSGSTNTSVTGAGQGPHSSSLLNKLDPRVNSNTGATSGSAGTSNTSGNYDGTHLGSSHNYGRDVALAGAAGGAGYEADKHHRHDSGIAGRDDTLTGSSNTGKGPHSSSLLNKMDPRVDSTTGQTSTRDPAYNSSTTTDNQHHYGRDAALAGGAGATGYEVEKHHNHGVTGTTDTSGTTGTSSSNMTGAGNGPHKSSLLNKLDPRVNSNTGETSGTGTSSTTGDSTYNSTGSGHHVGRDATLAGGAGVAGYEAEKHHHNHGTSGTTESNVTGAGNGPHNSSLLNKMDPRVDSNTGATSGSASNTSSHHKDHHHGHRDTAVASGAGATAVGAYEADKHHRRHEAANASTAEPSTTTNLGARADGESYLTGPVHHSALLNKLDPRVKRVTPDTAVGAEIADQGTLGAANPYNAVPVDSRLGGVTGAPDMSRLTDDRTTAATANHTSRESTLPAGHLGKHEVGVAERDGHNVLHKDPPASVARDL